MVFKTIKVNGLNVFYREGGSKDKPIFLLLHGFPTSSHLFRNLMPLLENDFHVIAPDYIGFGNSDAPDHLDFEYSFANLSAYVSDFLDALQVNQFYMYVFDYGAPIGFNLAVARPNRILGIVSQNGNIYEEGLGTKWAERKNYWKNPTAALRESYQAAFSPTVIKNQYLTGEKAEQISPDGYTMDIHFTESPDYNERQSDLIFDYQNNVANYPRYQKYVRDFQPDILSVWGKNDPSFVYPGAQAFTQDAPTAEVHLLDGGHFVLESHYREIAQLILKKWANQ